MNFRYQAARQLCVDDMSRHAGVCRVSLVSSDLGQVSYAPYNLYEFVRVVPSDILGRAVR